MSSIFSRSPYTRIFSRDGKTGHEILKRAGDAMKTGSASVRMQKEAFSNNLTSMNGYGNSQITYTNPGFYSPIHTPVNWNIPTKRREVYAWNRFFAQNDPTCASSLRFYSQFPFADYEHVIKDPIKKEYFDKLKKRLKLNRLNPLIAYEYFAMGDVFTFISFECQHCGGSGVLPDGSACNHPGGTIKNVTILNPDTVDVKINQFDPLDPIITMVVDDSLKAVVNTRQPKEVYDSIPDKMKEMIRRNQPIRLSSNSVEHLKHDEIFYQAYGRSLITSLFPILAYQDKLRQAQWIVADRHILPVKICKVGNDTRPASNNDIREIQEMLATTANDPNITLVTHHAFEYSWEGASGKVLQLSKEYELIDKALIKGLGVNEALLSGSGPSYSQAAIGIEATIKRLEVLRNLIGDWICEKIYKQEARMQGFYKSDINGNKVLDYPDIRWKDLNLRDQTQKVQLYMQLWDKQLVSSRFILETLDIDPDVEAERVRLEQKFQAAIGIMPGGAGGGKPGGPPPMGGGPGGGIKPPPMGGGFKGNLPGGKSGPGLPGDDFAPSMSGGAGGGAPAGSGAPPMAAYDTQIENYNMALDVMPKVTRRRPLQEPKKPKPALPDVPEEYDMYGFKGRTGYFAPTDIEARLFAGIEKYQEQGILPLNLGVQQYPDPVRMPNVYVDFMFPDVKLIIQADGRRFHALPEDIEKDSNIDNQLQQLGWTVLRFQDNEIETQIERVMQMIVKTYRSLSEQNQPTQVTSANDGRIINSDGWKTVEHADEDSAVRAFVSGFLKRNAGKIQIDESLIKLLSEKAYLSLVEAQLSEQNHDDEIEDPDENSEWVNETDELEEEFDLVPQEYVPYEDLPEQRRTHFMSIVENAINQYKLVEKKEFT